MKDLILEETIKDLLAQARENSHGPHSHWILPHIIDVLEAMLVRVHDPKAILGAAGALGRIVTDDYVFSESSLGGELLDLVSAVVSECGGV